MSQQRHWARHAAVLATGCVVLVCGLIMSRSTASSKPSIESMYHMWLGPNGLPLSPRKQRGLLFQFCTTNFVTEAEMRYCYARLLSVGNPSGPVKFSGQPQYDSEQVVSPLFTFSAPPMAAEEPAATQQVGGGSSLAVPHAQQQSQQLSQRSRREQEMAGFAAGLAAGQAHQHQQQQQQQQQRAAAADLAAAAAAGAYELQQPAPQASAYQLQEPPQPAQSRQQLQQQLQQQLAPVAAASGVGQTLPAPALPAPTSIVQPEPQGGARIITPIKLTGAAKASPQSEWAAFEAVQKANKEQWLEAQRAALHAAATRKLQRDGKLLPLLKGLPKMRANSQQTELSLGGPWYNQEKALAI